MDFAPRLTLIHQTSALHTLHYFNLCTIMCSYISLFCAPQRASCRSTPSSRSPKCKLNHIFLNITFSVLFIQIYNIFLFVTVAEIIQTWDTNILETNLRRSGIFSLIETAEISSTIQIFVLVPLSYINHPSIYNLDCHTIWQHIYCSIFAPLSLRAPNHHVRRN